MKEAEKTKNQGIVLIVIGVGDEVNEEVLVSIASHHRLYTASSYEALGNMGVRISVMLCQGWLSAEENAYFTVPPLLGISSDQPIDNDNI